MSKLSLFSYFPIPKWFWWRLTGGMKGAVISKFVSLLKSNALNHLCLLSSFAPFCPSRFEGFLWINCDYFKTCEETKQQREMRDDIQGLRRNERRSQRESTLLMKSAASLDHPSGISDSAISTCFAPICSLISFRDLPK